MLARISLNKLYVRIWLAVVLAVAVLTLLVGWAWRMAADPPLREVVVRNSAGEVIGSGRAQRRRPPPGIGEAGPFSAPGPAVAPPMSAPPMHPKASAAPATNDASSDASGDSNDDDKPADGQPHGRFGAGPEFTVRMSDGQMMHLHMPRPAPSWRAPFGFFWTLGLVAVAVAIALYPILRRLTRRLETLQSGVKRWGDGDLTARVDEQGSDEVGFLARQFNQAATRVESLVKARDALLVSQKSLLANASHELRSPLARIRMGLELMGPAGSASAQAEIRRNIGELDQLIDEILLASRLDAREADMGTIEAVDLVGLAAEECSLTNAVLDVEQASVVVPGVTKLLRRAVRNLLENARRYGAGEVLLRLRQEGDVAELQVSDRGPGVPSHLAERIFEPFYRLPGASEREGGVGLGLALVKSIAERHGGSVHCSNRDGGGACFTLRLPLAISR